MKKTLLLFGLLSAAIGLAQVQLNQRTGEVRSAVVIARSILNYDVNTGNLVSLDVVTREVKTIDGTYLSDAPYRTLSFTPAQVAAASTNFAATAVALRSLVNSSISNSIVQP